MTQATFYFDLGSPYAYLTAERLAKLAPELSRWQPLSLGALFKLTGRASWAVGDAERRQSGIADVEGRARGYGLPPLRWPDPWPAHYLMAMRAAIYACSVGRGREFALEAFRDAFVRGRDLSTAAHVLDAAQQAGLDRQAVAAATEDPQIKLALREATDAAHVLGVFGVPTLAIGGRLFWGDDRVDDALAYGRTGQ